MKEHPILFSSPMVRALLAGRKSVTRRMSPSWMKVKAGDRLWVRETWTPFDFSYEETRPSELPQYAQIVYLADQQQKLSGDKYRPSIFMPRWASRILLECEDDARMEPLRHIEHDDCMAEGIERMWNADFPYGIPESFPDGFATAKDAFRALWCSLHTKPGERWEDNPEVVRVGKFRRIE